MISPFGELLKERCRILGITQKDVAKHAGISQTYLTLLKKGETGRAGIPFRKQQKILAKLAEILQVSIEDIKDSFVTELEYINGTLKPELNSDKRIQKIVETWMWADKEEKEILYLIFCHLTNLTIDQKISHASKLKKQTESLWPHAKEAGKYKAHSAERADYIWQQACKDSGVGKLLNKAAFDENFNHYRTYTDTDSEFYNNIINEIEKIAKSISSQK